MIERLATLEVNRLQPCNWMLLAVAGRAIKELEKLIDEIKKYRLFV
ncbi:MAG TPA: hypothetical protein VN040_11690 [Pseudosphingobacterium sp.]|nr:hypothetical protein [Pseudosphingobacterium sp.]